MLVQHCMAENGNEDYSESCAAKRNITHNMKYHSQSSNVYLELVINKSLLWPYIGQAMQLEMFVCSFPLYI